MLHSFRVYDIFGHICTLWGTRGECSYQLSPYITTVAVVTGFPVLCLFIPVTYSFGNWKSETYLGSVTGQLASFLSPKSCLYQVTQVVQSAG